MKKLKGKVKRKKLSIEDIDNGVVIVLFRSQQYVVSQKNNPFPVCDYSSQIMTKEFAKNNISMLSVLVVEYQEMSMSGTGKPNYSHYIPIIKQIPLKYSQWKSSIKNNEIDNSEKEVIFQILEKSKCSHYEYTNCADYASYGYSCEHCNVFKIAKIIPQNKNDELHEFLVNVINYCETQQIYDKLSAHGDFYYKAKDLIKKFQ